MAQCLFGSAWWMRPLTASLVMAAVAVPWYVAVGVRTDGEWLRRFFIEFNLRPFKQPILGHGDTSSLDRALAALVSLSTTSITFRPCWSAFFRGRCFLGPTLVDTVARIRRRDAWRDGCLLASCWFGVWLVFWSICKTKLPHYLLPAYPALALLTACFIDRWQTEPATSTAGRCGMPGSRWSWWASASRSPCRSSRRTILPGEEWLGLLGLIPLAGGSVVLVGD